MDGLVEPAPLVVDQVLGRGVDGSVLLTHEAAGDPLRPRQDLGGAGGGFERVLERRHVAALLGDDRVGEQGLDRPGRLARR